MDRGTPSPKPLAPSWRAGPAAATVALALLALAAPAAAKAHSRELEIGVLSNRADLVSGGDALVQIALPPDADPALARVRVNGNDLTGAFAVRDDGRFYGLVTGLVDGANEVEAWIEPSARSHDGSPHRPARLVITNHPRGGPVFSGAQLEPWICAGRPIPPKTAPDPVQVTVPGTTLAAMVTPRTSGFEDGPDAQCNASTQYTFWYEPRAKQGTACTFTNTGVNPCFQPYTLGSTPDDDVAEFTNDRGDTVPAIVVLERGTVDRGIYQLVTFYDPRQPYTPWAPQRGWNGKLLWRFTPSTLTYVGFSRFQTPPGTSVWDDVALRRGYMVASSSLTDHLTNANDTLGAEALMMVKEHVVESYGEIRFTIGSGCSGGAISQYAIAAAYPDLLDGIQPSCTLPDTMTTAIEMQDCGLLVDRYYRTASGAALSEAQRAAIDGHASTRFCSAWLSFLPSGNPGRPANCGSSFPPALTYDPALRPDGVRCTAVDHDASLLGTFAQADGIPKARSPFDNVGVQYGLAALRVGVADPQDPRGISPEEFVRLNEGVGSYTADQVWSGADGSLPAPRSGTAPETLRTAYSAGLVSDGAQLAGTAIIDLRGSQSAFGDIQMNWRSWSVRDRLDRSNGHHDNQLIWAFGGSQTPGAALAQRSFLTLDRWLTDVENDVTDESIEDKIRVNRPADAKDLCFATPGATDADIEPDDDLGLGSEACPVKFQASPRQVAGGPLAEDVFKCELKPLDLSSPDYGGAVFTPEQQTRLAAVFPDGVCDWGKRGVEQVPADGWTTFADGPGGKPLGPPPGSRHHRHRHRCERWHGDADDDDACEAAGRGR